MRDFDAGRSVRGCVVAIGCFGVACGRLGYYEIDPDSIAKLDASAGASIDGGSDARVGAGASTTVAGVGGASMGVAGATGMGATTGTTGSAATTGAGGAGGAIGAGGSITSGGAGSAGTTGAGGGGAGGAPVDAGGALCSAGDCRRVFISSIAYSNPLGGVANADASCQKLANSKNLGGNWKAWLSDGTSSASIRHTHATVPYRLLNGPVVANSWADLTDGTLAHAIDIDENGAQVTGTVEVWTDADTAGSTHADEHCTNWTNNTATSPNALVGLMTADSRWTAETQRACNTTGLRLYCFEQATPVVIPAGPANCPSSLAWTEPVVPTSRGGDGGNPIVDACPPGQVLIGYGLYEYKTNALDVVGQMQGICGSVAVAQAGCRVGIPSATMLPLRGTTSNQPVVSQSCPNGQMIVGYKGRWGSGLDQVAFGCAPLTLSKVGATYEAVVGTVTWFAPVGGTAASSTFQDVCPAGQVASGGDVHTSSTVVQAFGLYCRKPILLP